MTIPPILCVTGRSNSGKTRLLTRLIRALGQRGLRVAAVKHCGHVDRSEVVRDSHRLADAGAVPVVAAAADGIEVCGAAGEPLLLDLIATHCRDRDLVLVEGYRRSVHDKILLGPPAEAEGVRLTASAEDAENVLQWVLRWLEGRRSVREGLIGAVLTGGRSRRMGTDKSALRIAGRRVLGRLCELLADRLGEVRIIGRRPDPRDVPACAAWHPDVQEGLGPLGGIVSALHVAEAGVCAVACDMVALGGNLLDGLLSGRNREAVATVPVNPTTGRLEPLAAIYEPAAAPSIRQALDAGTRSVTEWLESAGAHRLPIPPDLAPELTDADTPEDLQKLGTGT